MEPAITRIVDVFTGSELKKKAVLFKKEKKK